MQNKIFLFLFLLFKISFRPYKRTGGVPADFMVRHVEVFDFEASGSVVIPVGDKKLEVKQGDILGVIEIEAEVASYVSLDHLSLPVYRYSVL